MINFDDFSLQSFIETIISTFIIFWATIFILRYISSRVFSQTSPEYLLFLLLLASGMYSGISGREPTMWTSIAIGSTLLLSVFLVNKIPWVEKLISGNAIILVENGEINEKAMKRTLIPPDDLDKMAREYGFGSYEFFTTIVLEKSGHLTGIINFEKIEELKKHKKK